jgi:adenosylcobinamide kinase/adenosylcobinamide-phosphate guanylyltransferase
LPEAHGLTLVLGGARSGKSRHAEALIERQPPPWRYIATAQALDAEMTARIAEHRARRPEGWITAEAPLDLTAALAAAPDGQPVLIDFLTLWLTNLLLADPDADPEPEACRLATALAAPRGPWVAVANEVGLGIVPENALARRFRDAAGRLNQAVAAAADEVLLLVAGLPLRLK